MIENLKTLGPLRNMLHALALMFILVLPFAKPMWHPETPTELLLGAIIPATAPIVFIMIMFDVLMSQVMKSDANNDRLTVLNRIIKWHLVIAFTLLAMWLLTFTDALFL